MTIKPKLYLNGSPETIENGALAFAKNMKIDNDGYLVSDNNLRYDIFDIDDLDVNNLLGIIPGLDNKLYILIYDSNNTSDIILEYDEIGHDYTTISNHKWKFGGFGNSSRIGRARGVDFRISGVVTTNTIGEKILTIAEWHSIDSLKQPLKHINLSHPDVGDESLYCQAPKVPLTNLVFKSTYPKTIPNGVYNFYIRYKIRKDVYTKWYACSRPIFAGTAVEYNTLQGGVRAVDIHRDSAKSFIFDVQHIIPGNCSYYEGFQLGFIITHDEATDARIWKEFKFTYDTSTHELNNVTIYFDYENVTEGNIDEFTEPTYEIYNVGNITVNKNKLYISNYKESDINYSDYSDTSLDSLRDSVKLTLSVESKTSENSKSATINGASMYLLDNICWKTDALDTTFDYGSLNFEFSKPVKGNSATKENIHSFSIIFNAAENPDIAWFCNYRDNSVTDDNTGFFGGTYLNNISIADLHLTIGDGFIGFPDGSGAYYSYLTQIPFYNKHLPIGVSSFGTYPAGASNLSDVFFNVKLAGISTNNINYNGTNYYWGAQDTGFTEVQRKFIVSYIKSKIEELNRYTISYIKGYSGATEYTIFSDNNTQFDNFIPEKIYNNNLEVSAYLTNDETTEVIRALNNIRYYTNANQFDSTLASYDVTYLEYLIIATIREKFEGYSDRGTLLYRPANSSNYVELSNFTIGFKQYKLVPEEDISEGLSTDDTGKTLKGVITTKLITTEYIVNCTVSLVNGAFVLTTDSSDDISGDVSTLMPGCIYKPYIHFVDEHNIISKGLPIKFKRYGATFDYIDIDDYYCYSKTTGKIKLLSNCSGYTPEFSAHFISLFKANRISIECFDYNKIDGVNTVSCLEADLLLYGLNKDITLCYYKASIDDIEYIYNAKYHPSSTVDPYLAFGNVGYISWVDSNTYDNNTRFFICLDTNTDITENDIISGTAENSLLKVSHYIANSETGYKALQDAFYDSYMCKVKKPNIILGSDCYVSGNDVYKINRNNLNLTSFTAIKQMQNSNSFVIHSSFNFNFLSLTSDLQDNIFSINGASSGIKQVAKVINSATLSYIYELKPMYKNFKRDYFSTKEDSPITVFDNVVRVSNVLSDEDKNISIFKFAPSDYYIIPANRGIIVKLFSISGTIYVHTKQSLYKFNANQTITASDSDISLTETEPFDAGVIQVVDSATGYAGIDNKEAGIVTYDAYLFYDKINNRIFAHDGHSGVHPIDSTIRTFLDVLKPLACYTVHDALNNRVFFTFDIYRAYQNRILNRKYVTLSYNYKSKSFVSIHDFDCYPFVSTNIGYYGLGMVENKSAILSNNGEYSLLDYYKSNIIFGTDVNSAIIQNDEKTAYTRHFIAVVCETQQQIREVLNNLNYIGKVIDKEPIKIDYNDDNIIITTDDNNIINPVKTLYIITDRCLSNMITGTVDDDSGRPSASGEVNIMDYKSIKFDKGIWNSNYFRNILNTNNIYGYTNQPGTNIPVTIEGQSTITNRTPNSDNYSLVYGRYFIVVLGFITNKQIKIEEININTSNY